VRPTTGKPKSRRLGVWAVWLALVCVAAAGLSGYRIENALRGWMPELAGHDAIATFIIIGGEKQTLDTVKLATKLESLAEVAACVSPNSSAQNVFKVHTPQGDGAVFSDPTYTGLFCFAHAGVGDNDFLHAVQGVLHDELGDAANRLALGGPAVFIDALNDWSQRRLPLISVGIVGVGALLLWWVIGNARVVASATAAIVGSQVALVGVISWMDVPMNMVLSMVWPLMMALGFSFAAHRALRRGIRRTLALCALTTAAGIIGFVFCPFPPLRSFAVWGALGVVMTWASVMLLVGPARHENGGLIRGHQRSWFGMIQKMADAWATDRPKTIIATAAMLTAAAVLCLPLLQLQNDPIQYFPKTSRVYRDHAQLNDRLIGMLPFEVAVRGDTDVDVSELLAKTPGVRQIVDVSLLDPQHDALYLGFADSDALGPLVQAQTRWQDWATDQGVELTWSGIAAQLHGVSVGVIRVALTAFPGMVLIAGTVVWLIAGRSLRLALIAVWVNLFPVAVLILIVGLLGVPLSLPSLMIGAIAVGAAVDDTLHIVTEMRGGQDIRSALAVCWRPCVGSSFITSGCMAIFALSPFGPTAEFGVLMALAVSAALVGDMLLLPALLRLPARAFSP